MPAILLSQFPIDVRRHILRIQNDKKSEKGISQYSQILTLICIIREHEQLTSKSKK